MDPSRKYDGSTEKYNAIRAWLTCDFRVAQIAAVSGSTVQFERGWPAISAWLELRRFPEVQRQKCMADPREPRGSNCGGSRKYSAISAWLARDFRAARIAAASGSTARKTHGWHGLPAFHLSREVSSRLGIIQACISYAGLELDITHADRRSPARRRRTPSTLGVRAGLPGPRQ